MDRNLPCKLDFKNIDSYDTIYEGNILFNTYSSNQEHKLDGELVYIMSQNEVLSIVED